ncbi:MAG: hypothetical protein ACTSYB_09355, partial [Candidatus Helarchaeota archaeon]
TSIKTQPALNEAIKTNPIQSIFPSEYQAVIEDKKIWIELQSKYRILKKEGKIKVINENKLKKSDLNKYHQILNLWEQISATEFLHKFQ